MEELAESGVYKEKPADYMIEEKEVKEILKVVTRKISSMKFLNNDKKFKKLMGELMKSIRGRMNGSKIAEVIKSLLREVPSGGK